MGNRRKIGFDLGNHSLKIAVSKGDKWEYHQVLLPENLMEEDQITMPHAFSAFLKKTKKELGLPKGETGLVLPGGQVICRLVTMPRMLESQLLLNLPYEFSDFIHGEPHQYHCDYAMCRPTGPEPEEGEEAEMTMMAAAVEKRQVQEYVSMFAAGGFPLKRILPQEMALIQLVEAYTKAHPGESEEFCFIDLGYLSTRIFVVQGDRIKTTRRIPVGCRQLDSVVADVLNVDGFLADSYKRSNYQGILEHPRCVEIYEHIAVEALKLINFYHFTYRQNQLAGVYLLGGGAAIAPLRKMLEETLGLPALPVEGLMGASGQPVDNIGALACAAGLIACEEEEG